MWTLILFTDDNSVEPVPSFWVNKEKKSCVWPNNSSLANKLRFNRAKPNSFEYTSYNCRILSTNIESLRKAKEEAKQRLYATDVSDSDMCNRSLKVSNNELKHFKPKVIETPLKRKCISNIFDNKYGYDNENVKEKNAASTSNEQINDTSSNDDDDDDVDADKDYMPDTGNGYFVEEGLNKMYSDTETNSINSDILQNKNKTTKQIPNALIVKDTNDNALLPEPNNCNIIQAEKQKAQNTVILDSPCITTAQNTDILNLSCSTTVNNSFDSHKVIINYLAHIKLEINKIANNQREIMEMINNNTQAAIQNEVIEMDYFVLNWPISNDDDLMMFENKISTDRNFYKQVVNELAKLGGKTLSRVVNLMLKKVFDDLILNKFTYYGLRNKNRFHLLFVNKAIFEAVRKSKSILIKASSDEDIINAISKYMTGAKGRLDLAKKNHVN